MIDDGCQFFLYIYILKLLYTLFVYKVYKDSHMPRSYASRELGLLDIFDLLVVVIRAAFKHTVFASRKCKFPSSD